VLRAKLASSVNPRRSPIPLRDVFSVTRRAALREAARGRRKHAPVLEALEPVQDDDHRERPRPLRMAHVRAHRQTFVVVQDDRAFGDPHRESASS
jgi:hypothetical protein